MTEDEKKRRKEIWDSMAEEERLAAEQERKDILKWWSEEEDKAVEKIKAEGRYYSGLDGHYPELIEISKEANRRLEELLKRIFREITTSQ